MIDDSAHVASLQFSFSFPQF